MQHQRNVWRGRSKGTKLQTVNNENNHRRRIGKSDVLIWNSGWIYGLLGVEWRYQFQFSIRSLLLIFNTNRLFFLLPWCDAYFWLLHQNIEYSFRFDRMLTINEIDSIRFDSVVRQQSAFVFTWSCSSSFSLLFLPNWNWIVRAPITYNIQWIVQYYV